VGVPFEAVTAFFDPAVQFGFQFEAVDGGAAAEAPAAAQTVDKSAAPAPALTAGERPEPLPAPAAVTPPAPAPDGADAGGEVVRLDRFRKK
jgi:hypothetical protein